MKAIVLSCDKYIQLADHMIASYQNRWPTNPFVFRIPYNQNYPFALKKKYGNKIELIQTETSIKSTVLSLIADLNDEEWVYWCIDDKYPIEIQTHEINQIYNWLLSLSQIEISGVIFTRTRNLVNGKYLMPETETIFDPRGFKYLRRKDYSQIWIHQFLKVKVIRILFDNFPDQVFAAKEMDSLKKNLKLPDEHKLYVTQNNLAIFGESTTRGKLTLNCAKSFKNLGWSLPKNFEVSDQEIFI